MPVFLYITYTFFLPELFLHIGLIGIVIELDVEAREEACVHPIVGPVAEWGPKGLNEQL